MELASVAVTSKHFR